MSAAHDASNPGEEISPGVALGLAPSGPAARALLPGASGPDADAVAALAHSGYVDVVLLGAERVAGPGAGPARAPRLDPTSLALAVHENHPGWGLLTVGTPERDHPYNAARRTLTADNLTDGRLGLLLADRDVRSPQDATAEWTDGVVAGPPVTDDFARVLRELWSSFPRESLVADRETGRFARAELIRAIAHHGVYDVAGALGIPSSLQGEPVLGRWAGDVRGGRSARGDADVLVARVGIAADWARLTGAGPAVAVLDGQAGSGDVLELWAGRPEDADVRALVLEVSDPEAWPRSPLVGETLPLLVAELGVSSGRDRAPADATLRRQLGLEARRLDLGDRPQPFAPADEAHPTERVRAHE